MLSEIVTPAAPVFDYSNLGSYIPMMAMRPIEEVFSWMNMVIYGDYGVGKTWLAGSAVLVPQMCDILYLALEGGEKALKEIIRLCKHQGIDPNRIMVLPIQTYKQYAQIYETLRVHIKYRDSNNIEGLRNIEIQLRGVEMLMKVGWQPSSVEPEVIIKEMQTAILTLCKDKAKVAELIPAPHKFRTVITDSLTEAQKYCMYQILGIDPLKQKIDAEPDAPEWKDWGGSREMTQFLVRRYRGLDIHSIFICGRGQEQDARKQYHYSPLLPGQLSNDIRGLLDVVGYLQKIPQEGGKVVRRLYLEGGAYSGFHISAKHRFGSNLKGLWVDNPTMQTLYNLDND